LQLGRDVIPVVERRLERGRDVVRDRGVLEIAGYDEERAVARVVL
jgi:hypothetical protein